MHAYAPVEKYETDFEYNPDWGGLAPALWLPAAWQPNCGNDKVFDLSPYCQQPGTWAGSTAQRNVVTDRGRAWTFNGSDDYILPPNTVMGGLSRWSMGGWVYSSTHVDSASPFGGDMTTTTFPNFRLDDKGSGNWVFEATAYSSVPSLIYSVRETTAYFAQQTWYQIWQVYDGDNVYLYVDGNHDSTHAANNNLSLNATNAFRVGCGQNASSKSWNGRVADVCIIPDVLSAAQIRLLYESSRDGSPGVMARPIGPRWFPAAVVPSGYTVPLQLILECAQ